MAENPIPSSPTKLLPVIEQQQPSNSQQLQTMPSPSPSLEQQQFVQSQNQQQSQMVQQHQLQQLQQQLQNNNTNGIQRNTSMSRLNNQLQQNSSMNNQLGITRQQQQQGSGIYGQMSFGGMTALQQQQQQQQQNVNMNMISNNNNNSQLQNQQNQLQQLGQQNQLQQLGQQNQLQQLGQQNQLQQQQIGQPNQFQQQQQQIGQQNQLQQQQVGQQNQLHQQMGQQNQMQQSQLGQMGSGNFSRSAFMGQTGHLPLLSGQAAAAAAAQFGLHNQFMSSPRQKAGLTQGSQFHLGNSAGQSFPGIQGMGMTGPLSLSSQLRPNGALSYAQAQRMTMTPAQLRQQLTQQNALAASQKMQGQNITRTSFMNGQMSALAQNGQPAMMQNTLSQQQYLKQMPSISSPNSSSLRLQQRQQLLLQQQLASSQFNQSSVGMNQQQLSPIVQQLGQSQVHQQKQQQQQLMQQQPSSQLLNQQQSPRTMAPGPQKSASLTGSQQDISATGTATPGCSSSQGIDASNQLLGKRKIQDLVSQLDANAKLDPELEDLLLEMADGFINSVTNFACTLAKHRNSSTVEAKDVLLHLEKNLNLKVPGFSSEETKHKPDNAPSEAHKKRMDAIRNLMEPVQSEPNDTAANNMARQGPSNNPGGPSQMMIRPSPSADQLVSQPQMMQQQTTRFS